MDSHDQLQRWLGRVLGGLAGGYVAVVDGPSMPSPLTIPAILVSGLIIVVMCGWMGERIATAPPRRRLASWGGVLVGALLLGVLAWAGGSAWPLVLARGLEGGCMGGLIGRVGSVALRGGRPWGLGGAALGLMLGAGVAVWQAASLGDSLGLLAVGALGLGLGTWIVAATGIAFRRALDADEDRAS